MRIVLDANVLVSALISAWGAPSRILAYWQQERFELVLSEPILQELDRVLHYPKLQQRHRLADQEIRRFLRLLRQQAIEVVPSVGIAEIERDPADNRYLECALAGDATIIVSGDQHLLELGEYQGIQVLSPAGYLALLEIGEEA